MSKIITIREVNDPNEKSSLCERILRALPDWFGNEAPIVDYTQKVQGMPFFAACDGEHAVGFVALKVHNPYTCEVCVMGVLSGYHRQGAGRALIGRCVDYCRENGHEFLTVKTLDSSREDEGYARTREFYHAMGFRPLEVFPLLWDANNPCLFMARTL